MLYSGWWTQDRGKQASFREEDAFPRRVTRNEGLISASGTTDEGHAARSTFKAKSCDEDAARLAYERRASVDHLNGVLDASLVHPPCAEVTRIEKGRTCNASA